MIILLALAGGLGALVRWRASARLNGDGFPWGTLAVNVVGSFVAGWCAVHPDWAWVTVVSVGFLGGLTTFSTALVEAVDQARRSWGRGLVHAVAMLGVCLLSVYAGVVVGS